MLTTAVAPDFSPIEYKSLSDITAQSLRTEIIEGRLAQGLHLTETGLADKYAVSRVVIREAVLRLTQEGLLVKAQNKYTKVIELHRRDIEDILDLRIALEKAAAIKCLHSGISTDELRRRAIRIEKITQNPSVDKSELLHADMDFHNFLVRSSENSRLADVWERSSGPLLMLLYRYIVNAENSIGSDKLDFDHNAITRAFVERDEPFLLRKIDTHINETREFLLENY